MQSMTHSELSRRRLVPPIYPRRKPLVTEPNDDPTHESGDEEIADEEEVEPRDDEELGTPADEPEEADEVAKPSPASDQ